MCLPASQGSGVSPRRWLFTIGGESKERRFTSLNTDQRRIGPKEQAAERQVQHLYGKDLTTYLRDALNSGRSVLSLAREFKVNRHSVEAWMSGRNIKLVRRARAAR